MRARYADRIMLRVPTQVHEVSRQIAEAEGEAAAVILRRALAIGLATLAGETADSTSARQKPS